MHRLILHNGVIQPSSGRTLSPGQTGVMNGWGVFSTLRVTHGVLFAFERHWARMVRDAAALRVPMPPDPEAYRKDLLRLVEANHAQNSTLRTAVIRNRGGMFEGEGIERDYDVVAFTAEPQQWGDGVNLTVEPNARHAACRFAGTKMLSWSFNLTWLETAKANGFDEVILLNEHGNVSECTSANLFAEFDEEVVTPPLSSGCLPGVTREIMMSDLDTGGIRVVERDLTVDDLFSARAVCITSTTRDLLPVLTICGRGTRNQEVKFVVLRNAFRRYVAAYIAG